MGSLAKPRRKVPVPTTDHPDPTPAALLDAARALEQEGRHGEAIGVLTAANRRQRSTALETALVSLRHRAGVRHRPAVPDFTPPHAIDPPAAGERPPLEPIGPHELDVDTLRHGLATHGCVWVRPLISPDRARELASNIDHALAAFDAAAAVPGPPPDDGWYQPFAPEGDGYRVGGRRTWVRASGALWTADSPLMLAQLVDLIDDTGIGDLVTSYLGERPALSANKCTLRRVPLDTNVGWHQDGSFLGEGVRSLNLWLALGACGRDAPGMDLVPRRIDHVVDTGTPGAMFDWSVAPDVVEREAGDAGIVRPEFQAGDALLFDHLLLHSTCVEPTMTRERHAMETWLFAPSTYPEGQIPLAY